MTDKKRIEQHDNYGFKDFAGITDTGQVRKKNEDNFGLFPEQGLFLLSDGVGGLPAGDIASQLVVDVLPSLLQQRININKLIIEKTGIDKTDTDELIQQLKQALIDLSERIRVQSQNHPEYAGMAATLVMALYTEKDLFIAYLGDSRAYLVKQGVLQQLSEDHSLLQQLLASGTISEEQAIQHPDRHQLVQFIGMATQPRPDVIHLSRTQEEKVLLCSDGLTNMLSEQQIEAIVLQETSAEACCKGLIDAANTAGGKDNITVLLID